MNYNWEDRHFLDFFNKAMLFGAFPDAETDEDREFITQTYREGTFSTTREAIRKTIDNDWISILKITQYLDKHVTTCDYYNDKICYIMDYYVKILKEVTGDTPMQNTIKIAQTLEDQKKITQAAFDMAIHIAEVLCKNNISPNPMNFSQQLDIGDSDREELADWDLVTTTISGENIVLYIVSLDGYVVANYEFPISYLDVPPEDSEIILHFAPKTSNVFD